jgi:NAD(P)-dependent dehydrogenase (short-subunit alcohol dehydrogenase family)
MGRFEDRVAIVTGAGSGVGAAIAARLVEEGASVVCTDMTGDAVGTAERLGGRARAVQVDVGDTNDVVRLFEEVRKNPAAPSIIATEYTPVMAPARSGNSSLISPGNTTPVMATPRPATKVAANSTAAWPPQTRSPLPTPTSTTRVG